jgi:surface antigen
VLARGDRGVRRLSLYNGTAALRLCRQLHALAPIATALSALVVSGCSYRLLSMDSKDEPGTTGSIAQPAGQAVRLADASAPVESDLAYARVAASDVLARGGKDTSVPWQNPQTGAGGNITPLATAYSEGGLSCRDFLASYVHGGLHDWLQGAGCRSAGGNWEVKRLKPPQIRLSGLSSLIHADSLAALRGGRFIPTLTSDLKWGRRGQPERRNVESVGDA